jgi:hypothetical protein
MKTGRSRDITMNKLTNCCVRGTVAMVIFIAGIVGGQHSIAAGAPVKPPAALAGDWLGPMPGDSGRCGNSYSEFIFRENGAYSITTNSKNKEGRGECGGFTTWGVYEIRNDVIYFHQRGASPGLQQRIDYNARYRFDGGDALMLQDSGSGRWFTYYRQ